MIYWHILTSIISHSFGKIPYPYFVTYLITKRCNLKCSFCEVWHNQNNSEDELSPHQIEQMFAKLKNIDVLRISGGEPFLRNDIGEIINRIDSAASPKMVHFTTNGTLSDNIIKAITEISHPHKIHIKISLDALGARHDEIRGVIGTLQKVMNTIEKLAELRLQSGFHLGVNCTIAQESDITEYYKLKEAMNARSIPVYGVIASDPHNALYGNATMVDPQNSVRTVGEFSQGSLAAFFQKQIEDDKANPDIFERLVNRYHVRGLRNRLLNGVSKPKLKCVALSSHMRLLPNGDIPVCLYNGTIVGNLLDQSLDDVWFNNKRITDPRAWVKQCGGCWQSCESVVSAIYTGDIVKGIC